MKHGDYYQFALKLDGVDYSIPFKNVNFTLSESIYDLYNTGTFRINDTYGMLQEAMLPTVGTKMTLDFGVLDYIKRCDYTIIENNMPEVTDPNTLGGALSISLINSFAYNQVQKTKAHKGRISDIIKEVIAPYGFSAVDINDTGNDDIWYQLRETDAGFIERISQFAHSDNSQDSPFYAYISGDNQFHLRNVHSLITQSDPVTLFYAQESSDIDKTRRVNNIVRMQAVDRTLQNVRLYTIDRTTGDLQGETYSKLIDHPKQLDGKKFPVFNALSEPTAYLDFGFNSTSDVSTENKQGFVNNFMNNLYFKEHFIVSLPLTKTSLYLGAGETINLRVSRLSDTGGEYSTVFSDNYLIESADFGWMGSVEKGMVTLVIGRRTFKCPNDSKLKQKLLG